MAKIQLGKPPKNFQKELSFPMLDGTVGHIKVTYKYRSRTEFSKFVDAQIDDIKAEGAAAMAAASQALAADNQAAAPLLNIGFSESDLNEKKAARQVEFIMGAAEDWNLDVPFDREAVAQLIDELPLAAETIIRSYREAITEGRLGN